MSLATKFCRMLTYFELLLPIKSQNHVITWFWRVVMYNKEFFNKVIKPCDQVLLQGHVTNYICYISTITKPLATRLGKVITYYEKFLYKKSYNPFNMWSCKVT